MDALTEFDEKLWLTIELGMKLLSAAFLIPHLGFFGTSITEPITWTLMLLFLAIVYFTSKKRLFSRITVEMEAAT